MNDHRQAARIFSDIEKLYRLLNVYSGDMRQCEKHVEFIDRNLEKNLRQPLKNGGVVEFDLLMTSVYWNGEEVFSSKNPEFSLAHALFCEGLKSVSLRNQLTARELVDWMLVIRKLLLEKDLQNASSEDLASVLWRKNSPNIQIALYSQLMKADRGNRDLSQFNIDEDADSFEAQFIREALRSDEGGTQAVTSLESTGLKTGLDSSWFIKDDRWQLPTGEKILQNLGSLGKRDPKLLESLRHELSDISMSDRARKIVRFSPEELGRLRKEMEHLDQTQVDFNGLVHYISMLECAPPSDWPSLSYGLAGFKEVMRSVVDRFHPGLILFILRKIEKWSTRERYRTLYGAIGSELRGSINKEENLRNIAEAFGLRDRQDLARDLLKFVDWKYVPYLLSHQVSQSNESGMQSLFQSLLSQSFKFEEEVYRWPEDLIVKSFSILAKLDFPQRAEFLGRGLRNRSARVRDEAVKYVAYARLEFGQAISLFERLSPSAQRAWLESLLSNPAVEDWRSFVAALIRDGRWSKWNEEVSALFVRLTFKYMGKPAVDVFEPWIFARKFVLWPKYPQEREMILRVAMSQKEISNLKEVRVWADKEKSVIFQNGDLKHLLSMKARAG
jgi:hypothetical protein